MTLQETFERARDCCFKPNPDEELKQVFAQQLHADSLSAYRATVHDRTTRKSSSWVQRKIDASTDYELFAIHFAHYVKTSIDQMASPKDKSTPPPSKEKLIALAIELYPFLDDYVNPVRIKAKQDEFISSVLANIRATTSKETPATGDSVAEDDDKGESPAETPLVPRL